MEDDAKLRLDLRLVPADDQRADPVVLDDIVRLIRQAVVTAPKEAPKVTEPAEGFRQPSADENRDLRSLESRIKNRIEQASAESQAAIEKRAETAKRLDGEQRLKDEALRAAEQVISAVQRAILRGVAVRAPETPT